MHTFTNHFSIFVGHDNNETIIDFFQDTPIVPAGDNDTHSGSLPTKVTPVANLIMTRQCAENLYDTLGKLLGRQQPE